MYNIGDKIFYPMHGAGEIKDIQTKNILGDDVSYYVISLPNNIKVMAPVENQEKIGIRPIISKEEALDVIKILEEEETCSQDNWSKRYNENKDRLKTGDVHEIADIYRNLSLRNLEKNLSTGEKKMLLNAKNVLISELSLSVDLPFDEIEKRIEKKFEISHQLHVKDEE